MEGVCAQQPRSRTQAEAFATYVVARRDEQSCLAEMREAIVPLLSKLHSGGRCTRQELLSRAKALRQEFNGREDQLYASIVQELALKEQNLFEESGKSRLGTCAEHESFQDDTSAVTERLNEAREVKKAAELALNRQAKENDVFDKDFPSYRKHWLEEATMDRLGGLVFILEITNGSLHGFVQYHMLPCVCHAFRRQCSVLRKIGHFHPLKLSKRDNGWLLGPGEANRWPKYPRSNHPLKKPLCIGSVVTHMELYMEHMTQKVVPQCRNTNLSADFVEMMKDLPDKSADDLFNWAKQTSEKKKLLIYHAQPLAPVIPECQVLYHFCPLVHVETMLEPAFQAMFPVCASTLALLFKDSDVNYCFMQRNTASLVPRLRRWLMYEFSHMYYLKVCRRIMFDKSKRYLFSKRGQQLSKLQQNGPQDAFEQVQKLCWNQAKTYASRMWCTTHREFLWDLTPPFKGQIPLQGLKEVPTHKATAMCLRPATINRVLHLIDNTKQPQEESIQQNLKLKQALLLSNSVHQLPELLCDLQTGILSYVSGGLECNRFVAVKTTFPVCIKCQGEDEKYKFADRERPNSLCCLRKMYYQNYTKEDGQTVFDPTKLVQCTYTSTVQEEEDCFNDKLIFDLVTEMKRYPLHL